MIRRSIIFLLPLILSFFSVTAQDETPSGITDAVPLVLSEYPVIAMSESGTYYAIGGQNLAVQVLDLNSEVVANFGFLYTNDQGPLFIPPVFYGDDRIMTRSPDRRNVSPKLYSLPDGSELARLITGLSRWDWVTVGEDFWYYDVPDFDITRARLFYQPVGGSAVLVSGQLGYATMSTGGYNYTGDALTSPDGSKIYLGTLNGVLEWDIASQERIRTLPFPSPGNLAITPDGRFLSTTTNSRANWRVIDLESGEEVYSNQSQGRSAGQMRADGAYVASSQGLSDAGNGNLSVVDLASGEEVLSVERVFTGDAFAMYNWLGDNLFFLRDVDDGSGLITIFNPETGELTETDRVGTTRFNPTPDGQYINIGLSLTELGYFNEAGELVRVLPITSRNPRPIMGVGGFAIGNIVFGTPSDDVPALPIITGTTNVDNVNIRSFPSADGTRINGATGAVEAVARNNAGTWVLLASHGGWASVEALTLDGNVEDLTVFIPR